MTPETIHLLAQLIRHQRAQATSIEKWVRTQPASPACRELVQLIAVYRGVLKNLETQVSQFDFEVPADAVGETVGQR